MEGLAHGGCAKDSSVSIFLPSQGGHQGLRLESRKPRSGETGLLPLLGQGESLRLPFGPQFPHLGTLHGEAGLGMAKGPWLAVRGHRVPCEARELELVQRPQVHTINK